MCKLTELNTGATDTESINDVVFQHCDEPAERGATLIEYTVAFTILIILWSGIAVYLNQRAIQRAEEGQTIGSAMGPYGLASGGGELGTQPGEFREPTTLSPG